ncbi:MAG: hypothetical protein WCF36_15785 [Candidatus Nanopelagicales bacterium]
MSLRTATSASTPGIATFPATGHSPALNPTSTAQVAFGTATLPGGGSKVFTRKTYVALYGHPGTRALGVLGEQGTSATIRRAKRVAAAYRPHTTRTVVPALEIIATIASASAGRDGDYSAESSIEKLAPLVTAARRNGVYVVLDLQPGRTDFLTQAKRYRSLLKQPHVGLALDPEWRLKPGQRHLRQIGSVDAREINRVADWLAHLTRKAGLPQKMLLLHQFRTSMIGNRSALDTSHPEIAMAIQMDGLGSQPAKQATWRALRAGAPRAIKFGWKNFIDEDRPMLNPRATMKNVDPQPRWVSYQ